MMPNLRTPGRALVAAAGVVLLASCGGSSMGGGATPAPSSASAMRRDPRVGLRAGQWDAEQAIWNARLISSTRPQPPFLGVTNSDLAFTGKYAIQGNYNGYQVWDISNPAAPTLAVGFLCPASQSDVSTYKNLLFVSGEGGTGRLDCGAQGNQGPVSHDRLRGLRIFDITDITHPRNVANVQTCRGSHTHTVLVDPKDPNNVYVYISGSAGVRSAEELPGCSSAMPSDDPNSALFRIEVIKVPLAHPEQAAIVSSPRIFNDLAAPPTHGETATEMAERAERLRAARARGAFIITVFGNEQPLNDGFAKTLLDSTVKARGGTGPATSADSAALRAGLPELINRLTGGGNNRPRTGPTQCHDITVYPAIGLAGGACEGYGLLLDISDPVNPRRIGQAADSNFSYWHSATFNNDGSKILFSDEWGGGGGPKCRASDPLQWGADALFTIENRQMRFQSYYKMAAPQTVNENCVAHNGSLIPIPGRDVMVQSWYQGGISIFDWTDAAHPKEIAFFDRGPADSTKMAPGGTWSVYWYNGVIVSSEIARGLDILELTPSEFISQNEIDAAKTVKFDYLNVQGQQQFVWPASFAKPRAFLDQLARNNGLAAANIASARQSLSAAEGMSGAGRAQALHTLGGQIDGWAGSAMDGAKVRMLAAAVHELASAQ
ncbi:MAG TPA: hypothetical protein VG940_10430 [Gemmatimonadales bacterium]|nr:hypothetical protein [Gemmatimonadales bacterium]